MGTLEELQTECDQLRRKLLGHDNMQMELENVKAELEQALEAHKRLQEVALALEQENRTVHEKYKVQLRERAKLDETKLDLENELETKSINYENLEKRFNKIKEKVNSFENLEDLVYSLEKDKRRNTERIKELEEELETSTSGSGVKSKEYEEQITKLTKENKDLISKLDTYMEEMEELDTKNEQLEKENKELKRSYEQVKSIELVGSNLTELVAIENEKEELEAKLKKEISKRETVENELFKLEEEFESFKIAQEESEEKLESEINKINQDLLGRKVSSELILDEQSKDQTILSNKEMGMKFLLKKKQKQLEQLEKENNLLKDQIKSYEQEHQILLEENSALAKDNMQMDDQLKMIKTRYDNKVIQLQDRLETVEDKRKQMEQENLDRLMTSAEKEYEYSQKHQENHREVERMKEELKVMQEYLRVANDKNAELQIELEDSKRELYQQQQAMSYAPFHNQQTTQESYNNNNNSNNNNNNNNLETSSTTSSINSQESDKNSILQRMALKYDEEKEEYECKIYEQNNVIKSLEARIISLRNFYEHRITEQPRNGAMSSPETTPPVAIKNGRLHDSMDDLDVPRSKSMDFSEDELEIGDTVSDRELRRISYKIADGNWKHLSTELNIRRKQDVHQILNSKFNDQEKVYRLLVCWRNETDLLREEFLKQLIERIGSKRKDVTKFLKEMAGLQSKDGTIKTKFQKFKKSVKRSDVKYSS